MELVPPPSQQPIVNGNLLTVVWQTWFSNLQKKTISDVTSQTWVSPDGSRFQVTMSNAGTFIITPL